MVSTETINTTFGSLAAIDEWGLILNNEMDDFAAEPGKANAYGLVHSERNAIAPGKRPLSSMTPTIVLEDGKPFLMLGASGGPRIITSVLNVLLAVIDGGMTLEQAMQHVRPHHQWRPEEVFFDAEPPPAVKAALVDRGHVIAVGSVEEIRRSTSSRVQDLLQRRFEEEALDVDEYLERLTADPEPGDALRGRVR